jgi:hypothetical protein
MYRGVELVLLRMGSVWMLFENTILPFWRYNLDGDCGGGANASCFVGIIARKGVPVDSDLSCLSQSNNIT